MKKSNLFIFMIGGLIEMLTMALIAVTTYPELIAILMILGYIIGGCITLMVMSFIKMISSIGRLRQRKKANFI